MRNPYSSYERPDENELRRQALLDALDEPTPGRTVDRTRPSTPEPVQAPGQQPGVSRPHRAPSGIIDPVRAGENVHNAYTGPTDETMDVPGLAPSAPPAPAAEDDPLGGQFYGAQILDSYDDKYQRRGGYGGSDPKRQAVAGALLSSGNPYGMAAGALGYLDAYFHRRAKTAPTDFNLADAQQIVRDAYKDFTGGDISEQELDQYIRGQGWEPGDRYVGEKGLTGVLDDIARKAAKTGMAAPAETPATETPAAAAATPAAGGPAQFAMEGFNLTRAQDPSFSVKDAFAAAVRSPGIPPPPGEDKAALGEWFAQYVAPSIEAQGHKVNWIDGDRVSITGPQGTGEIDWYRGAGAPGGALAWQPQDGASGPEGEAPGDFQAAYQAFTSSGIDPNDPNMQSVLEKYFANVPGFEEAYKESVKINGEWYDLVAGYGGPNASFQLMKKTEDGGGAGASGASTNTLANLAPGVSLTPVLGNSDVLQQIMAEIQRIQSGAPPRDALLNELRG